MPNSWTYEELGEICKVTSGGTPRRDEPTFWDGEIPWVTTAEIKGGVIKSSAERITQAGIHGSSAKVFPINTVLVAMYGQGKTRGMSGILGLDASTNQACAAILPSKKLNPQFLFQYLNGKYEYLRSLSNLGGQQNLSGGIIKSLVVPIPPAYEQTKIVEILSTWDKSIEATERLLENSKKRKKALMQQLLTGKKRLPGFNGEWGKKLLGNLAEITTGSSNRQDSGEEGEFTFFDRSEDIRRSPIYLFDTEAVIVAGEGQSFIPKHFVGKFDLHQRTYAIMNFNGLNARYLFHFLSHSDSWFQKNAVGSTVKSLRLPMFTKMPLLLPSLPEQEVISGILDVAESEIRALEQKINFLKGEKMGLMQQLLTGKKRVVFSEAA